MFSAMIILPNIFRIIPAKRPSVLTSFDATEIKPFLPSSERLEMSSSVPLTVVTGQKVARPAFWDFKYDIAAFADASSSVTMFWRAPPSAVSTAREYFPSTSNSSDTGPYIFGFSPLFVVIRPVLYAFIINFTEREYPSNSSSMLTRF